MIHDVMAPPWESLHWWGAELGLVKAATNQTWYPESKQNISQMFDSLFAQLNVHLKQFSYTLTHL